MKRIKYIVTKIVEEFNYIVPRSNFSALDGDGKPAYLLGIPCEVVSEPYKKGRKGELEEVIDVVSCVTGLKYTIPMGWSDEFQTLEEANHASYLLYTGRTNPKVEDIIGLYYFPKDNSYIKSFDGDGRHINLYGKVCKILSIPFKDDTEYGKRDFVLVEFDGKVYRTLWEEWCLYPRA